MKDPKVSVQLLQSNLKELLKAWKASHESVFKIHWKKFPPFSWVFPQVDFLRIQKLMSQSLEHIQKQQAEIQSIVSDKNLDESLRTYFLCAQEYLDALGIASSGISAVAAMKHAKLKKEKIGWTQANTILKDYEQRIALLMKASNQAKRAFHNLEPELRNSQT